MVPLEELLTDARRRIEIAEPPGLARADLLDLLAAAARGEVMIIPVALRGLLQVPEAIARIVRAGRRGHG